MDEYSLELRYVHFPTHLSKATKLCKEKLLIDNVIGMIDVIHVKIQSPVGESFKRKRRFEDRKADVSLSIQMVCGADRRIYDVCSTSPGRVEDAWRSLYDGASPTQHQRLSRHSTTACRKDACESWNVRSGS
jgi:hypothetical protein